MKVLLVRPQAPNKLSFTKILDNEPLELEYLHTVLANAGYEDYIYDGLLEKQTVLETIMREKPDVIAITGYITQQKLMIQFCETAKNINPEIATIIGGVHAQRNYENFYEPNVDFICRSESCDAFVELISIVEKMKNLKLDKSEENNIANFAVDVEIETRNNQMDIRSENKYTQDCFNDDIKNKDVIEIEDKRNEMFGKNKNENDIDNDIDNGRNGLLTKINGLCYKNEQGLWKCNDLVPIDINSLPIPDRTFFYKNKENFRYLDLTSVATIKTSFSCPFTCNFCYCTLLAGGRYNTRNLDLVIEELKNIDARNIQIVDDDFLVDRNRLIEFIRLVKENKIEKTYICYARADFVARNSDIVETLADIGFKYFLVGLEAVTDEELTGYNKQTGADVNKKCVEVIRATSAHCIALMIAPIDATKEYFDKLYKWVLNNDIKYVTVSIFTPIPGTPLYNEYKDRITSKDIEDWDFLHLVVDPVNLSRREFYRQHNKLFLRLYQIAKKTGIYDFMDLKFYKRMLQEYLRRKIKGN